MHLHPINLLFVLNLKNNHPLQLLILAHQNPPYIVMQNALYPLIVAGGSLAQ